MADYINREVTLKILTRIADCVSDSRRRAVTRCIREIALLPPANVEPVRRWIPCSERMPEEKGCYLVAAKHWLDGKPVTREAFWNGADWLSCEKKVEITPRVTHWQPLPEPPK